MVKKTLDESKKSYENKPDDTKKITAVNPVNKKTNPLKILLNKISNMEINTEAQKTYEDFTLYQS